MERFALAGGRSYNRAVPGKVRDVASCVPA